MGSLSLLSVFVLYPMVLFGDGCILIAIALAATVGGRPLVWGASFALFHALYGIFGLVLAGKITTYSETLGDIFILAGSLILLRHFMHHSLHHHAGGDCSCENHKPAPVSVGAIASTASAFSLHSLASGAIIRGIAGEMSLVVLMVVITLLSLFIGTLIGVIVFIGDLERTPILRGLDSLPGLVASLLTGLVCFSVYHLANDLYPFHPLARGLYLAASMTTAFMVGVKAHNHRLRTSHSPNLTQISPRQAK
jgi:hypothetical protein